MDIGYRKLGPVMIGVLLLANVLISCFVGEQGLLALFTVEGLFWNGIGAIIALTPDLAGVSRWLEPTEKIERIERAQDQLFLEKEIVRGGDFDGYDELVSIVGLSTNMDLDDPYNLELVPHVQMPAGGGGGRMFVHFSSDAEETMSDEVGPALIIDRRISDYVDDLRDQGHQMGFYMGFSLIATGFLLQFVAAVWRNADGFAGFFL